MKYLFQLGHQPQISAAEITAVLSLKHPNIKTLAHLRTCALKHQEAFLILEIDQQLNCADLIGTLGGTIKIARQIETSIPAHLNQTQPTGKIIFSLPDKTLAIKIKKELKQSGRSVRYIEPKNTATILHNNLVELGGDLTIINNEIFATEAIQPFEEFSQRDYGRPGSDDRSGMLPPKLARILINLSQTPKDATLLDPFCGSGTILTEASTLGYTNLIGSDISEKAIKNTKENLDWLAKQFNNLTIQQSSTTKLFQSDAAKLSNKLQPHSINTIITEPLLGKPLTGRENKEQLRSQADELAKLYIDSFKAFAKILKPDGVVLFIIPKFKFKNEWVEITCVEEIKKTGFAAVPFEILGSSPVEHLAYHRPNQHLARTIWRFVKNR
ncbi:MAG: methyltransferase domain-containing protein [Candidatus Magasanikbacteria bacterium]|nr:methyltransferase domain-containing protein [Candidatus Magasanikbacteria bacterium]